MTIEQLNDRFAIAGQIHFESGEGGLIRAVLQSDEAQGHVYLLGAHVTHYRPAGSQDVLFTSTRSHFEAGKPIRGGIPICFPWFSNTHEPAHGFARLHEWSVQSTRRMPTGVELTLTMTTDAGTNEHWPHKSAVTYRVRVGRELEASLEVRNLEAGPIVFEEALHTYLAVGDIRRVSLTGLKGVSFLDKNLGGKSCVQSDDPLTFSQYTDRVYQNTAAECVVDDPTWNRRIHVLKSDSNATVVWNPWIERAIKMEDFGDEEWPGMLCVETANVGALPVRLAPGAAHRITTTLSVEKVVP